MTRGPVDEAIDAFLAVSSALYRWRSVAFSLTAGDLRGALAQLGNQAFHAQAPAAELFRLAFDLRGEDGHRFEPIAGRRGRIPPGSAGRSKD